MDMVFAMVFAGLLNTKTKKVLTKTSSKHPSYPVLTFLGISYLEP